MQLQVDLVGSVLMIIISALISLSYCPVATAFTLPSSNNGTTSDINERLFERCKFSFPTESLLCQEVFSDAGLSFPEPDKRMRIMDLFKAASNKTGQSESSNDDIISIEKAYASLEKDKLSPNRVISMSLYGQDERYTFGVIDNAGILFAGKVFTGWRMRLFYDSTVPSNLVHFLNRLGPGVVELFEVEGTQHNSQNDSSGMFWRFMVLLDESVTRYLIRDCDARLTERDYSAVQEWILSSYSALIENPPKLLLFHAERDHPSHTVPIMGGIWGSVGGFLNVRSNRLFASFPSDKIFSGQITKQQDQSWLRKEIWPAVKPHALVHDSFHCDSMPGALTLPYPVERRDLSDFVGNIHRPENGFKGLRIPKALASNSPWKCAKK